MDKKICGRMTQGAKAVYEDLVSQNFDDPSIVYVLQDPEYLKMNKINKDDAEEISELILYGKRHFE